MLRGGPSSLKDDPHPRTRVALAASLLLHVLLVLVLFRLRPWTIPRADRFERVTVRQILTLTKKRPPRPPVIVIHRPSHRAVAQAAAPAAPVHRTPPAPRSRPQPRELAKIVPHAPAHVAVVPHVLPPNNPGIVRAARPQLSGQQLAQIQSDLGAGIAQDRANMDPLRVPPGTEPTMKHYAADYATLSTGERRGGGLCDPVKSWTDDGWNYYYVACNVRFSDGTVERQGVPWPIRFSPTDDPFNGTAHDRDRPIAMPLPGWHLGAGETITVFMRAYAHSHGVDI